LALLHYRGGADEFSLGVDYSRSEDAGNRATGAEILAQLGWSDRTYQDESVAILTRLLSDSDPYVIHRAAVGLGHRFAPSAIPYLLRLADHSDALVRYRVVLGLTDLDFGALLAATGATGPSVVQMRCEDTPCSTLAPGQAKEDFGRK
jgi:hypothetical protein